MYQRKYFKGLSNRGSWTQGMAYLTCADLIEGDEGEGLRQHGVWKVFLGQRQRDEHGAEQNLWYEC